MKDKEKVQGLNWLEHEQASGLLYHGVPTLVLMDKLNNTASLIDGVTGSQVKDWLDTQLSATFEQLN